jgi:hypothetical protein
MIEDITLNGSDRIDIIKRFISNYGTKDMTIPITVGKSNVYHLVYQWFDSSSDSSYKQFYYNKIKDGMMFSLFDINGYMYLNPAIVFEPVIYNEQSNTFITYNG